MVQVIAKKPRGKPWAIASHPEVLRIHQMILDGVSVRAVAKAVNPPLLHSQVQKYKQAIVRPALERAIAKGKILAPDLSITRQKIDAEAAQDVKDAPLLSVFRQRLESLHHRIERGLDKAEEIGDLGVLPPLFNQAHKNVELLGRATGEIDAPQNAGGFSLQIICPSVEPDRMPRVSFADESSPALEIMPLVSNGSDDCVEIGIVQKS